MKKIQILKSPGLALAALLALGSASLAFAQTPDTNLNAFATSYNGVDNTEGVAPLGCGSAYGAGSILWDNQGEVAQGPGLYPGTQGAAYVIVGLSTSDPYNHPVIDYICFPIYDNWYYDGSGSVDLSQYSAVQFEVLWDTNNSSMSIDQFNDPASYQSSLAGSIQGLEVDYTFGNGDAGEIGVTNIPDAASNGWVTITIPIPDTLYPTAGTCGIMLDKYIANESSLTGNPTAYFWVANVQLLGNEGPPPPPTLQVPTKPTPGLNVVASTDGNTYYDRQEVGLVASNGVSWVGNDLTSPVTYSFTINGFPQNPTTYGCEAYLMMAPNPAYYDNAIDYNETNCVLIYLQQSSTNSTMMNFQYKVNDPGSEDFTTIGTVTNTGTALGTWSITFTSDTNVLMTAPDGNTSSFVFTNAASFAEVNDPGMYLYLGMQANNAASLNQAVCYSQFSMSGVPAAFTDNFLTDSTLNTNIWYNFMATGPTGVFVTPPGAENWVTWSLPASGFQLQTGANLLGPWNVLNHDLIVPEVGQVSQLITTNDLPIGAPAAFFELANP